MRCLSAGDIESHDAEQFALGLSFGRVLNQGVLHDAYQRFAVGSDGESFHAFISYATFRVAGNFDGSHRRQVRDEETGRRWRSARWELEGAEAYSSDAVEFVNVRAVFVGNVDAQAFSVESGVGGIAGVLGRIEIIGASGEEMEEEVIERRSPEPTPRPLPL